MHEGVFPDKEISARFAAALYAFIMGELAVVVALTPMNIYYKTALLLLGGATLLDIGLEYFRNTRSREQAFLAFATFFIGLVFILLSNSWKP